MASKQSTLDVQCPKHGGDIPLRMEFFGGGLYLNKGIQRASRERDSMGRRREGPGGQKEASAKLQSPDLGSVHGSYRKAGFGSF